jgi:hypothetical protein
MTGVAAEVSSASGSADKTAEIDDGGSAGTVVDTGDFGEIVSGSFTLGDTGDTGEIPSGDFNGNLNFLRSRVSRFPMSTSS